MQGVHLRSAQRVPLGRRAVLPTRVGRQPGLKVQAVFGLFGSNKDADKLKKEKEEMWAAQQAILEERRRGGQSYVQKAKDRRNRLKEEAEKQQRAGRKK